MQALYLGDTHEEQPSPYVRQLDAGNIQSLNQRNVLHDLTVVTDTEG